MKFYDFENLQVKVHGVLINLVRGGHGYPLLLLHGYPQTYFCWHLLAPLLASSFTVICADLRGFGDSGKPISDASHRAYSKKVMALEQVQLMEILGYDKFAVIGHDRGARVAHRMALDHPDRISKISLLDIIPTSTAFNNINKTVATNAFNWFFSIQSGGLPERLIGSNAKYYLNWCLENWAGVNYVFDQVAKAEYERCFNDECIISTCEEFRAASTIDLADDESDKTSKIQCPTQILWSENSMWASFDIIDIWSEKAHKVIGHSVDCGHFLPEEAPEPTAKAIIEFLKQSY